MKKKLLALASFTILGISNIVYSQSQQNSWCATSEIFNNLIKDNPSLALKHDSINSWLMENSENLQRESEAGPYIIPVVVHIIHNYGPENISDAQIASGIAQLNMDFQGTLNADHADVVPEFQSIIGLPNIEFRLAKLDPSGNCTNGITRTQTTLTYDARDNAKVISWPRSKYYNVWIVSNIYSGQPASQGVTAGYAYYPGMVPNPNVDGIIMAHNYFGTMGTSSNANFNRRVVSHETGHYLNLAHPWGDGSINNCSCAFGDGVGDTPCTSGSFSTCNLAQRTCDGSLDNVQNIMDYSTCTNMFTQGQVNRMITALNSSTGQRSSLITASNALATGTNDGYSAPDCAPKADFTINKHVVCIGTPVSFRDASWNGTATSWHWNITNGTETIIETNQNPSVTFTEKGIYNVTLTVSNSTGNGSITRNAYINVIEDTAEPANLGFREDFENNPIASGKWNIEYTTQPNNWNITNSASYSGSKSAKFPNIGMSEKSSISLYSPVYDFTNVTTNEMTFKYAYARVNSSSSDLLRVFVSDDCGVTWLSRGNFSSSNLNIPSVGYQINNWTPTTESDWAEKKITSLQSYLGKSRVMFKFEFTPGGGNNFYLDDINIGNTFGVSTPEYQATNIGLTVFPNPTTGEFTVAFQSKDNENATIQIMDLTGRIISSSFVKNLQEGLHNEIMRIQGIPSGMYFINVYKNNTKYSEKLIIK